MQNKQFTRRDFLRTTALATTGGALALSGLSLGAEGGSASKPNVLFIGIDDLNDWLGCFGGHSQAKTPNIDRLAKRGVVFENCHCQSPICNPSRASLLTSSQPSTTGLHFLKPIFRNTEALKDAVTLPQHFREQGYHTMGAGKVFHRKNDPASFDEDGGKFGEYGPVPETPISWPHDHPLWDWGPYPEREEDTPDHKIAAWAVERLQRSYDKPFFLAAGFYRPHVPLFAPQRWFDLHPLEKIQLPQVRESDCDDVPDYALQLTYGKVAPRHKAVKKAGEWAHAVQAYLACVSFVDHQVGKLLDALDASPYAKNTQIVLWSDHGFHLGEKQRWGKRSLWEESTRSPLIFAGPGIQPARCPRPVGLIDIYPTLNALCGMPKRKELEGRNLQPLLANPKADWPYATLTSFGPGNHSVRSEDWRYVQYADGSAELYDHRTDPQEWTNVAGDAAHAEVIDWHKRWIPQTEEGLVPRSAGSDSPLFP